MGGRPGEGRWVTSRFLTDRRALSSRGPGGALCQDATRLLPDLVVLPGLSRQLPGPCTEHLGARGQGPAEPTRSCRRRRGPLPWRLHPGLQATHRSRTLGSKRWRGAGRGCRFLPPDPPEGPARPATSLTSALSRASGLQKRGRSAGRRRCFRLLCTLVPQRLSLGWRTGRRGGREQPPSLFLDGRKDDRVDSVTKVGQ